MMERIKSLLLILLISSSLLQSYMLAYNQPRLTPMNETQYIETELLGQQLELGQMIFPHQIIIHSSQDHHTVLYPNSYFYELIFDKVKQRTFEGFRDITRSMSGWEELRHRQEGIEIVFKDGIPLSQLISMMAIEGELFYSNDFIDRIWLTKADQAEEVQAFFFSVNQVNVYESARVELNTRDLEQFIGFGAYMPAYTYVERGYYLPDEPIEAIRYRFTYDRYTLDQLKNSLFIDPSISQKILDRDGTEILTDGKRGIIVDREQEWMSFSDYVPTSEIGNDVRENLTVAVQFINRHGGWNGQYLLTHVPSSRNQTFVFRQYYDSYPIVTESHDHYGYMKIILQKGVVSNYERSLINLDFAYIDKSSLQLPGGEALRNRIESFAQRHAISAITIAYHAVITDDYIDLIPKWAAELTDGSTVLIP